MAMTRAAKIALTGIFVILLVALFWPNLGMRPTSPSSSISPSRSSSSAQPIYHGPDGKEVAASVAAKQRGKGDAAQNRAQQRPRFSAFIPDVGSVVRLYNGTASVLVGADENALGEMDKAIRAKDDYGRVQLVMIGRILLVDSGTRSRVLDIGFFTHEVRILEGKHQGRKGWVRKQFVGGYVVRR